MVTFNELYLFDDESDNDGSVSGSSGMCAFPFRFEDSVGSVGKYVGRVSDVGSSIFFPTGIELIGDFVPLVMFLPKVVKSKSGRLVEIFCHLKY